MLSITMTVKLLIVYQVLLSKILQKKGSGRDSSKFYSQITAIRKIVY